MSDWLKWAFVILIELGYEYAIWMREYQGL